MAFAAHHDGTIEVPRDTLPGIPTWINRVRAETMWKSRCDLETSYYQQRKRNPPNLCEHVGTMHGFEVKRFPSYTSVRRVTRPHEAPKRINHEAKASSPTRKALAEGSDPIPGLVADSSPPLNSTPAPPPGPVASPVAVAEEAAVAAAEAARPESRAAARRPASRSSARPASRPTPGIAARPSPGQLATEHTGPPAVQYRQPGSRPASAPWGASGPAQRPTSRPGGPRASAAAALRSSSRPASAPLGAAAVGTQRRPEPPARGGWVQPKYHNFSMAHMGTFEANPEACRSAKGLQRAMSAPAARRLPRATEGTAAMSQFGRG